MGLAEAAQDVLFGVLFQRDPGQDEQPFVERSVRALVTGVVPGGREKVLVQDKGFARPGRNNREQDAGRDQNGPEQFSARHGGIPFRPFYDPPKG
ncbi:hypothetical protein, partial [Desulfovibrio sp.]